MRALLMAGKSKAPITQPGIYRNASKGVISLSSDGTNWLTIADKNLGATQVYNDGDALSEANCGNYYQWGNNYGFPFTGAVTTSSSQVNAGSYGPFMYYSGSTFITSSSTTRWCSNNNVNLWGDITNTNEARRGPCDEGYHIPSNNELTALISALDNMGIGTGNNMKTYLKAPFAGFLQNTNASLVRRDQYILWWTSTSIGSNPAIVQAYSLHAYNNDVLSYNDNYASALSIRPFYNTPTAPDSSWTVLYQGTGNAGIYHNATLGLISISSDGTNWITIADKNLGATQVYNDGDTLSEANCGKYYQWGNNYGFPFSGSVTTSSTQVSTVGYGGIGYYSSSTFITNSNYYWDSSQNGNLWGGVTGTNEAMRGPCAEGYHIPSYIEINNLYSIGENWGLWNTNIGDGLKKYLKIPLSGSLSATNGTPFGVGDRSYIWTTTLYNNSQAYYLYAIDAASTTTRVQYQYTQQGYNIRPFANTPIQPDSSWEVLYVKPNYKTFTVSWTETSNPASFNPVYSDDATGLTAGSTEFDKFFGYSAVRLSSAGVETAEITQAQSGGDGKLDVTQLGTLTSGDNVMIKFPRRGIKMSKSGSTVTLSITDNPNADGFQYYAHTKGSDAKDYLYLGAYKMGTGHQSISGVYPAGNETRSGFRSSIKSMYDSSAGTDRYSQITIYPRWYINALYMMKYGNPNSQSVVGNGYVSSSASIYTGGTNSQINATYGTTANMSTQMKLFGLENWWGYNYEFVEGCYCDGSNRLTVDKTNSTFADNIYSTVLGIYAGAYIKKMDGSNDGMFRATEGGGTATTYYTDYGSSSASYCVMFVGGAKNSGTEAGIFYTSFGSISASGIGARLQYL